MALTAALQHYHRWLTVAKRGLSNQLSWGIKLVELVYGVCWGCVFFLISTQSYQGIKFVKLVDDVCWG
ncbi:hypothetical protein LAZ67_1002723 [Cordylochernes scorpioides]|uniref:Uncharacterized protein n=1 Tax=Cordylochernes scorpioides TaxID=51811 RepID=A0ABY6JZ24_9ARAC|nr:hypothetical protein LAZ67_1002723 [Cordylochernes scorpioides]